MTDDQHRTPPPEQDDPAADTAMFRAFAQREEPEPPRTTGTAFRVVTLLIGLAVFAALVWLLLR
ncbi:MAG TPA: hypothetical protein VIK95_10080 [Egibacteraceae bacterium]